MHEKCRLCGSRNLSLLYKFAAYRIAHCHDCGFMLVLDEQTKKDLYTLYSKKYFTRGKYINDKAIKNTCYRRIHWLRKNGACDQAKILDVGCATGDFISHAKLYFDMWGIDISEDATTLAKQRNPELSERIICRMIEESDFPDDFFDVITLWDVLEHLRDPVNVFLKLSRFLKKGGILTFSTPNAGAPVARLMRKYWAFMTVPEHLCFFNRNTIDLLHKRSGLKTIGWTTKGAWINIGFLINKAARIAPFLFPGNLVNWIIKSRFSKSIIYVPTGDIQFCAAKK
ncbi:MAG: class I SAM-dependent methyltransferase [Candidatus Omnitrophica bacterium]|nr:class I SAM-dependent methyltransferase [Candidatus Omnitrophota bacterium]